MPGMFVTTKLGTAFFIMRRKRANVLNACWFSTTMNPPGAPSTATYRYGNERGHSQGVWTSSDSWCQFLELRT